MAMFSEASNDTRRSSAASLSAEETKCKPAASRIRRVLIMDDDELVCDIMVLMLVALGYRVLLTESGDEAVASFLKAKACGEPVDVVILDLHVPAGMNGKETAKRLLEIDPEVKTIVTSGDATDPGITNFREFGFKDVLVKPFIPDDLKKVLSSLAPL